MRTSMWTYAWDVQDLGADRVCGELHGIGINTVSLAASYHAGRFLQPRSPVRKCYYPEDGTIYFQPTPALWEDRRIRPQVSTIVRENDVLRDLVRRRDAGGLGVACWTVCLHNTRLGIDHPDAVTVNAFGDRNRFNLCPSHPDARAYVTTLVADLSAGYRPDAIELESPGFMAYAHGYHHEKDGVGLTPEDDFLLSICFCPSCLARARRAGIDGEKARLTVRRWLMQAFDRPTPRARWPDFPTAGLDPFTAHGEVLDYLRWRFEPVTSLLTELRDETDPDVALLLIDGKNGWLEGCDPVAGRRACDGAVLCAYDMPPAAVADLVREAGTLLGRDKALHVAFRLFHPEMGSGGDLREKVEAATTAGCDGLAFYNYGLVPEARLRWIGEALQAAGSEIRDVTPAT